MKIQTYSAQTMTLNSKNKDFYIKDGRWKGQTLYDLYKKAETPFEWHQELFEYSELKILLFFNTFRRDSC